MAGPTRRAQCTNISKNAVTGKEIVDMLRLDEVEVDDMSLQINTVRQNTEIIRRSDNWLKLAFLEALAIKEYKPKLNCGIKSCKDLILF